MASRASRYTELRAKLARARAVTRRVAVVAYDGAQSLDVTGPFEAFAIAAREAQVQTPGAPPPYEVELLADAPRTLRMSSGLRLVADRDYATVRTGLDTLVVAGGDVLPVLSDARLLGWLRHMAPRVRRLASVCSGSFLLAEAGLLAGRRATTHWAAVDALRRAYPEIAVEPDAIFVRDGNVYTSAGVTAGIDLALALIEEDLGHRAALAVARRLVVFLKRPGGQSQFSSQLAAQSRPTGRLGALCAWILDHLSEDLSVDALAARSAMSPRNFARVFRNEMGVTAAKFVERARLESACLLLEDVGRSLDEVATGAGFSSTEQLRRACQRQLHVGPEAYRRRFRPLLAASA